MRQFCCDDQSKSTDIISDSKKVINKIQYVHDTVKLQKVYVGVIFSINFQRPTCQLKFSLST
jgi:hypothetical protein